MKKPWIAGLLNAFPLVLGLGYLYIRRWNRFFFVFGLQIALGILSRSHPAFGTALALLWIMSIMDVLRETRALNKVSTG